MGCHLKAGLFIAATTVLGLAAPAFGQQELNIRRQGVRPYTVEFKPLPSGVVPGMGLGAEVFILPKAAVFLDADYADASLPNETVQRMGRANADNPVPDRVVGYDVVTGLRYYASPALHSWYAGLGIGYTDLSGTWTYNDTSVDSRLISVLPKINAGYRWLFSNNFLLRVGAGAAANMVQSQSATATETTADSGTAEDKVTDLEKTPVLANVDFGLGYAF